MTLACTVVVATRDRAAELQSCLARLRSLPERPALIVVDNGSSDESVAVARDGGATVLEAGRNLGAAARNLGAAMASTPYVAFCDDDASWSAGSLAAGVALLERFGDLALVAPSVLVRGERLDPVCEAMAAGPLGLHEPSGLPLVLGFIACAALVRKEAFLGAGGFAEWLLIGGEEALLAMDLAREGWALVYSPELCARHDPSASRDQEGRRRLQVRNDLWVAWSRRRPRAALAATLGVLRDAAKDPSSRAALAMALRGLPSVARKRRPLPWSLERSLVRLQRGGG